MAIFGQWVWNRIENLILRKKQKIYTIQRNTEIMQDCVDLVNDSCTLSVVARRYEDLIELLHFFSTISERDLKDSGITDHPDFTEKLNQILQNRDLIFNQAIERTYKHEKEKAAILKTEKGRGNRMSKIYNECCSVQFLSPANRSFLNELFNDGGSLC